jgi:6-phosphogluconolactonase
MDTTQFLLAGSYAPADQPGIYAFHFDDVTGALTAHGSFTGVANPSFLAVHPNGRWLYAVGETSQQQDGARGSVWALCYARDPWSMQPINQQPSHGDSPCHLLLDSTGRWLLVSNYTSGSAALLPILEDGALGEATDVVQHQGSSAHPERQAGPHAHSATLTPDERFVLVADLGMDQVLVYAFDRAAGKLGAHAHAGARPGAGPRHMAFHPSGQILYVANELDSTVTVYDYVAPSGALHERQTIDTLPHSVEGNSVADIHIAPSGQRLYVSNRGHNSLAVYDIGADGLLTAVAFPSCGGKVPRNFGLAPGGRFVLAANQNSGDVSVLPLLAGPEAIGAPVARAAVPRASFVGFVGAG